MQQRTIRSLLGLALTLLLLLPVISDSRPALLQRFELDLYDWRLGQTLLAGQDPRIVIVDIDERSLLQEGRWPWARDRLALLLERLFEQYGVAQVGFDMVFAEPDTSLSLAGLQQLIQARQLEHLTPPQLAQLAAELNPDRRFAAALNGRNVVLGYPFNPNPGSPVIATPGPALNLSDGRLAALPLPQALGVTGNLPQLQAAVRWSGYFDNPLVDPDGVYRRVPLLQRYGERYYPSLALAMVMALFEERSVQPRLEADAAGQMLALTALEVAGLQIPVDVNGAALVPYRGGQGAFPYLSAAEVINGRADPALLAGAIVLVGTTAPGLLDLRVTPLSNRYPGVEVHANLIAGILDERIRQRPDFAVTLELLQLLLGGLLVALLLPRLSALAGSLLVLGWGGCLVGFNFYAWFQLNWVIPLGYSLVALVGLFLLQQTLGYVFETRNRRQLAAQFGQYVPPEVVAGLSRQGAAAALQGESRDMTVFFSDLRDFTSLAETLSPQQLTRLMNIYLTHMTRVIHQHRGTVDKYIGDAVMAFWGAPVADLEHPRHALQAALAMQAALAQVNRELAAQSLPPIRVGMGLNCGEMSVGNMGSSFRMAYTVMGDAVNLASRLEGLTKYYGCDLLVSAELAARVPEYCYREVDRVRVKGRREPVTLLQPLGPSTELNEADQQYQARFAQALAQYRAQHWEIAETLFNELALLAPQDRLCALYLERIEAGRRNPLGSDWDGVYSHTAK